MQRENQLFNRGLGNTNDLLDVRLKLLVVWGNYDNWGIMSPNKSNNEMLRHFSRHISPRVQ